MVEESTAPSVLEAVDELDSVKEVFIIGEHPGCTPVEQLMLEGSTYIQLILLLEKLNFENLLKLSKSIIFLKCFQCQIENVVQMEKLILEMNQIRNLTLN